MKWPQAVKDYRHYLQIERGLSLNSIENYNYDIKKLISYLEDNQIDISPDKINNDLIKQFIYTISKTINQRSQGRLISGLRNFFDYLSENFSESFINILEVIIFCILAVIIFYFIFVAFTEILLLLILLVLIMIYRKL